MQYWARCRSCGLKLPKSAGCSRAALSFVQLQLRWGRSGGGTGGGTVERLMKRAAGRVGFAYWASVPLTESSGVPDAPKIFVFRNLCIANEFRFREPTCEGLWHVECGFNFPGEGKDWTCSPLGEAGRALARLARLKPRLVTGWELSRQCRGWLCLSSEVSSHTHLGMVSRYTADSLRQDRW